MLSSSGFRDALGERDLRFDRESGQVYERLVLRPEVAAYQSALRSRIQRLASLDAPRLVPVEELKHDPANGRVTVVSHQVSGLRLQQILRNAREHELVPDLTIALFFTAELLTAVHELHALSRVPHGTIAPDRIIVTPAAEVVLADYVYAEAIESARFTARRLWQEFGIASALGEPFSFAGDVRQSALVAIALMLGRPLDVVEMPDGLDALLIEVEEAAMIRGGRLFAEPVIAWLTRALGASTFDTAEEAAQACAALLTDRERATARPGLIDFLEELDQALEVALPPRKATPAVREPVRVADEAVPEPAPPMPVPVFEPEPEFESEPAIEAGPTPAPVVRFEPEPLPAREPARQIEPEPEVVQEPVAVNGPVFSTVSDNAPPAPAASTSAWPPPPTPAFEVGPDGGPRVVSPSPLALVQGGARAKPVTTGVQPPATIPPPAQIASPMPIPQPMTPLSPARDVEVPAAQVTSAPQRAGETGPPIRLKSDSGLRLKDTPAPKRSSSTSIHLDLSDRLAPEPPPEEADAPGWTIPWKYVAVALVVLATGFAATRMDWGSSGSAARETDPVATPPPRALPPPTTGALQVLTNEPGSKVLIDGTVRGETPLTIDDLEPGRHVVVVRAPNGNVRRTIRIEAGKTAKLDLAVYSGWVIVNAPIELQVFDGDKSIGPAGDAPLVLTAGHHELVLVNEALGYRSTHPIDIQPGEEQRLVVDPKGTANLNAEPWAEVWLDGNKLGETPLANVSVPLGTREFVFKHPEYGERRVSTTITGSATAQISVDFTKP